MRPAALQALPRARLASIAVIKIGYHENVNELSTPPVVHVCRRNQKGF
jgi:hypothetical protein